MKFRIIKKPNEFKVPKARKNPNIIVYKETLKIINIDENRCELSYEIENKGKEDAKEVEVMFSFKNNKDEKKILFSSVKTIPSRKKIIHKESWWRSKFIGWFVSSDCLNAEVIGEIYYDETCEQIKNIKEN